MRIGDEAVGLAHRGDGHPAGIEHAQEDAVAAAVLRAVGPGQRKTTATQRSQRRLGLQLPCRQPGRVALSLHPLRHARGVVALEEHAAGLAAHGAVVVPGDDVAAVLRGGNARLVLVVQRCRVHPCLNAGGRAIGQEALRIHAGTAAVLAVRSPGDDEVTPGQAGHLGFVLRAQGGGVDAELGACRVVVGIEALAVHAVAVAIGAALVLPDDDVAAAGQWGHRGVLLVAGHRGVDDLLGTELHRTVVLGRHVDLHRAGHAGAAVTVRHTDGDGARRDRVAGRVGVGQVLDQPFHRLLRGTGIEQDAQLAAVGAVADDGADRRAAVADGVAADADLAGSRAHAAHAQLVLVVQALRAQLVERTVVGEVVHLQQAAAEVGRIGIEQPHARVDDLGHDVDQVLGEGEAGPHVHQVGVGAAHQHRRVAEHLLENLGAADPAVEVGPRHHEGAAGQGQHLRQRGSGAVVLGVNDDGVIDAIAGRAVLLHQGAAVVVPGHHEAAARQGMHAGLVLVARRAEVDAEFLPLLGSGDVEALAEDAGPAAILAVGAPHDHEAAARQRCHVRFVLRAGGEGVDQRGRGALGHAARVEAAGVDAEARAVAAAGVGPGEHEAPPGQRRQRGIRLRHADRGRGRGDRLRPLRHPRRVVTLEEDVLGLRVAVAGAVVVPGHHEAAVCGGGDGGLVLVAVDDGVDAEVSAHRVGIGVEALAGHRGSIAVAGIVTPDDDEATARQAGHVGFVLVVGRVAVDLELAAHRHAHGVEALAVHAEAPAVLVLRVPHRHVAAVGQPRHRRLVLRARRESVHRVVGKHRLRTVGIGGDVDRHRAAFAGAAVTVADAHRHRAAGLRRRRGVGVGQVLDQPLHRVGRGIGIQAHRQLGAVGAVADDRADGRSAQADGVAGHPDLAGAVALVADAQLVLRGQALQADLVLRAVVGEVVHLQDAAGEVGRVGVGQAHVGVDQLRRRVDHVLLQAHAGAHIHQHRVGPAHLGGRVTEELLVDVVVGDVVVVVTPGHDKGPARQRHHLRQAGVAAVVAGVHAHLLVHALAAGVVLLHEGAAVVVPGHHEAAAGQCVHARLVLVADDVDVDAELAAHRHARGAESLAVHAGEAAVLVVGPPHDHEAAGRQRGDVGFVLGAGGEAVDGNGGACRDAGGVESLREHALAAAVGTALVGEGQHEAATRQRGHAGLLLRGQRQVHAGVAQGLGPLRHPGGVVALEEDVLGLRVAVAGTVVVVGHHEAAVGGGGNAGLVLAVAGDGVDAELGACWHGVAVKALGIHACTAAVLAVGAPGHDEAAARQPGHGGLVLVAGCVGVDLELAAHGHAQAVEALAVHAVDGAVLGVAVPDGDVATIGQLGAGRIRLSAGQEGVDGVVGKQRLRAVSLGCDVDRHQPGRAAATVAVAQADADRACRRGRVGAVAVGQVLDQRFHGAACRVGVEQDHQVVAGHAVDLDRGNGRAAKADGAAGHADLPGAIALVAHAEQVLRPFARRQLGLVDRAIAGDGADPQPPAAEAGAVGVEQRHLAVDQLRRDVDQALGQGDRSGHALQRRVCRARDAARRAEQLLLNAVAAGRVGLLVETGPGDDEVATGQARQVRLVLGAGPGGVGDLHAVHLVAAGVELLQHDVLRAAAHGAARAAVPADDVAAAVQRCHAHEVALVGRPVDAADQGFQPLLVARGVESLHAHGVVVFPGDHEAAAGQHRDVAAQLVAAGTGVDQDLGAHLVAVQVEALRLHGGAAGIARPVGPAGHEARAHGRQPGLGLPAPQLAVEGEVAADGIARGVEHARPHIAALVVAESDHETPAAQAHHAGLVLGAAGAQVGAKLAAGLGAVGVVALGEDAVRRTIGAGLVGPGDDVATVAQGAHGGLVLGAQRRGVDAELGADAAALGVVTLGKDALAAAVLHAADPGNDVAAVVAALQPRHRGGVLAVRGPGVGLPFAEQGHGCARIAFGRDGDGHVTGRCAGRRTIGHHHADRALGVRAGRGVGVLQAFHHPLDGLRGGAGVEGDLQAVAIGAIERGAHRADGHALVADGVACKGHLVGRIAGVAHRQLVVGPVGAVGIADGEPAVVEAGTGVVQLHRVVQQHAGIGLRFGEGGAGAQVIEREGRGRCAGLHADAAAHGVADAAVAVGHPHAEGPAAAARCRGVGVDDVLGQRLHRRHGGIGIERHRERGDTGTAAGLGADDHAAVGDAGA